MQSSPLQKMQAAAKPQCRAIRKNLENREKCRTKPQQCNRDARSSTVMSSFSDVHMDSCDAEHHDNGSHKTLSRKDEVHVLHNCGTKPSLATPSDLKNVQCSPIAADQACATVRLVLKQSSQAVRTAPLNPKPSLHDTRPTDLPCLSCGRSHSTLALPPLRREAAGLRSLPSARRTQPWQSVSGVNCPNDRV